MSFPDNNTENAVGVEVTTSTLRAVCIGADGAIVDAHAAPLIRGNDVLPQIVGFINELRSKFGTFDRIGITFPGLIHRDSRRIAFSSYFPDLHGIDVLGELEAKTRLKVLIENDANAAGFGEFSFGAGRDSRNMFYVTLGTGVPAGTNLGTNLNLSLIHI